MTIAVRQAEVVPDDVDPPEVFLAVTALLLRAGLDREAVPSYPDAVLRKAVGDVGRRLTYGPLRRPA